MNLKNLALIGVLAIGGLGWYAAGHVKDNIKIDNQYVVTIKPLHSLVSAVAQDVFTPRLLLDGALSPHTHSLTPHEIDALKSAKCVFWIGDIYEEEMASTILKLVAPSHLMTVSQEKNLKIKKSRAGPTWGHTLHHEHQDGHIWMNLDNAKVIVKSIARHLSQIDPSNAEIYLKNCSQYLLQLSELEKNLKQIVQPIRNKSYILYHDAMFYFDDYFGTQAIGAITREPGFPTHPKHLQAIKLLFATTDPLKRPSCIFAEPHMGTAVLENLSQEFQVPLKRLDYLGTDIPAGPQAYEQTMIQLAITLASGLK